MPATARRMGHIKPSAIVQVSNKAQALKKQGRDIVSFSIGVPSFLPPKHVYDAAKKAADADTGTYLNGRGEPALLEAFLSKLTQDGFTGYNPENLCVGVGAKNILFNLFYALLNPEDEVIVPAPYWSSYMDMLDMVEAKPVTLRCESSQNYKLTPSQLEAAITPQTKMMLFNNPSNPTGMVYTKDEIAGLAAVLKKHDIWLVSDDIYDRFIFDGETFHHLLHAEPTLKNRTIIVQSISKTYGMPGWRVGIMAGPEEVAKCLTTINANTTMNIPGVCQAAAAAAFSGPQDFVLERKDGFARKRDKVMAALDGLSGVVCPRAQGAFYVFPDVSGLYGTTYNGHPLQNDVQLCELLLEEAGVALVPGSAFGEPHAVRISYACKDDILEKGLERVRRFFEGCAAQRMSA